MLLSHDGHRVEVFERAPQPGPVGAGFLLQPTGLHVLWTMGLLDDALVHGARIERLYGETTAGRAMMDMRYRELEARLFGLGMQRGALFELLDATWTLSRVLHAGVEVTPIDVERGRLRDADGRSHGPFDRIVFASGAASALRRQVAEPALDRPYPWGAQWCLVLQGDWRWPDELRQRYLRARRMAGLLPVGTRPGDPVPRLGFFWSLPVAALDAPAHAARWRADVAAVWRGGAGAAARHRRPRPARRRKVSRLRDADLAPRPRDRDRRRRARDEPAARAGREHGAAGCRRPARRAAGGSG